MDNSTDAKTACTECGEPMTDSHQCAPATGAADVAASNGVEGGTAVSTEPRIEIPESLWASGLFKPAFTRAEPMQERPAPAGSRGSIFDPGYEVQPPASDEVPTEETPSDEPEDPFSALAASEADAPLVAEPQESVASDDPWAWTEPTTPPTEPPHEAAADEIVADEIVADEATADELVADETVAEADESSETVDEEPSAATDDTTVSAHEPYDPFEGFDAPADAEVTPSEVEAADVDPIDADATDETPVDETPDDADADETRVVETIFDDTAAPADSGESLTALVPLGPGSDHFESADLPTSVPFAPAPAPTPRVTSTLPEPEATEEAGEKKKGRKGLLIGALVLVLVAATGGWFAWQRQQDAPVRTAFEASHAQFTTGASHLEAATSIDQVALAGKDFADAVPLLEKTSDVARERGSSFATSARRAALAELEVARAGSTLADLSTTSLTAWSQSRSGLERAFEEYAEARTHVEAADGTPAEGLTAELLEGLQQVIGDEVAGSAAQNTTDLLDRLQTARLVADWRGIGDDAQELVDPMKAAEEEFADDAEKADDLAAYRTFFSSLGGLSALRPANLDGWAQAKNRIENAVADLPTDADRARRLLEATDRRIVAARTKFADWQTAHAEAKAEKQDGLAQLAAARDLVPEIAEEYAALREEVAAILARGPSFPAEGANGEAHGLLTASEAAHTALQGRLTALTVPSGAATEYAALAQVIADDAGAVRWTAEAAASCTDDCDLTERPGWTALVERSEVNAAAWDTAREAWQTAAGTTRTELRQLKLPKRPKI